ncbi:MAG: spore cortex-lytic enzyme, partial [Clostridia bacterium]
IVIVISGVLFIIPQNDVAIEVVTLKSGSKGNEVKKLQQELKNQGFFSGSVDGVYGTKTVAAVKKMQKAYGLKVDGIAGEETQTKLGIKGTGSKEMSTSSQFTNADEYLLAKAIYAEARGEPYVGKVAVGAVILNRVKSSKFPNSISGVVYQPWAFTAVNDGQINLTPDAECKRAAKDAMSGWDPTYGCIYYYNPAKATSKWIFSTKKVMEIGKHVFSI